MTTGSLFDNFSSSSLNNARAAKSARQLPPNAHAEAATGRPIRYSVNGRVEEPEDPASAFMAPVQRMIQDFEAAGEHAVAEFARTMSELNPYTQRSPEECPIKVRGVLRKNAADQARVDAYKANKDRTILLAELMKSLAQLGDFSHFVATEANERMWQRNQARPAELQSYGEFIRLLTGGAMGKMITEMLTMHPDMGMEAIARSTYKKPR
jgi:hypothetical protein